MSILFLDLPPELIIRIFYFLDLIDLISCQLTHSALQALLKSSIFLDYRIATEIARVEDNPRSTLAVSERLEALVNREAAWSNIKVDFSRSISVGHNASGIYDLTGGVYLLGEQGRHTFYYCTLPSTPSDPIRWKRVDIGRTIIDVGLAVHEHDLIAVITTCVFLTRFFFEAT